MFPTTSNASDTSSYDFNAPENAAKWQGLFVNALQKVQSQVHPSLTAREDALDYIESLILRLLKMLCSSQPHTILDVEQRVSNTFPYPIDKWAVADAQNAIEKGKKKSPLVLPLDKIHSLLVKDFLRYKIDNQVTMYIVAVLEYIAADILKLTGNYVRNIKHQEITLQDIKVAMCVDKVLMDMFCEEYDDMMLVEEEPSRTRVKDLTYEQVVKDLILEEKQYLRDTNMIIKVFREPFVKLFPKSQDLENIFSNILEVHELTCNVLSQLEDTIEMTEDNEIPLVGPCIEELAEGAEFDVYEKYTEDILKPKCKDRLNTLVQRQDVADELKSAGSNFRDAVKYVLPNLLLGPIFHCLHYFDVMKVLIDLTRDEADKESLETAYSAIQTVKVEIERKLSAANMSKRKTGDFMNLRFQGRAERDMALQKMAELQKSIDGWEGKNIGQSCHEFLMEGTLTKYVGKRPTDRYVFLFDGLIIFTKQNLKRSSVTGPVGDYKLKEKFMFRRLDTIIDRDDCSEMKNAFELHVRDHPAIVLAAKTNEEKAVWMSHLISLQSRSTLERMLENKLSEEEKQQPLRLPEPCQYGFAQEDSDANIVFEERDQAAPGDSPLIKGGTLLKLVERLTYHMYADPKFVRTFLTTYRTFCKPEELLTLLIQRFEIPDPPPINNSLDMRIDSASGSVRDDLKRFRQEYAKPVQFRVLNVLRHWVDQHWYDFEMDVDLLNRLNTFLDGVKGKAMKKWVESITKIITRKSKVDGVEKQKHITFQNQPPPFEWHIAKSPMQFDLMTLHPIEIARQVTLLEFDMYRAVKPSEMVGVVWTKKDKNITSPNLLKMMKQTNMFTYWLEKCIIEASNIEERVAVVVRILEVMVLFQELNHFNGVLEVSSALLSAPVHRLEHTFEEVDQKHHKLMKAMEEATELASDHLKRYYERLRSINPPCVPFLGNYLTSILQLEQGNPDFLPNHPEGIINFSKRRKVAEITAEIQQYQNQPYCLKVQPDMRKFFETLDPLEGRTAQEFTDYLYAKSLEIEPRNCKQPPKFEKKYSYSLKSPGIKPASERTSRAASLRSERLPASLMPASLSSNPDFRRLRPEDDEEELLLDDSVAGGLSCGATPPTPGTPLTPPPHDISTATSDSSVFTTVMLPDCTGSPTSSVSSSSNLTASFASLTPPYPAAPTVATAAPAVPQLPPAPEDIPPPLPPRKKRESSTGELSPIRQMPEPPARLLPSSLMDEPPPPLPPRTRDRMSISGSAGGSDCVNLSPVSRQPIVPPPHSPITSLPPRRNSDRDYTAASSPPHQPLQMNGERGGSRTPELPPRTYKPQVHSRKQSS